MTTHRPAPIVWIALVIACVALPRQAEAAGPWRAQIVDAKTGQPLEGVVVLAEFTKYTSGWAGDSAAEYYESDEVVTGPDGRFEIGSRTLWNPVRWRTRIDVEFRIFKPGYGRARPREGAGPVKWRGMTWLELLQQDGVVIELPPLKTREERRQFFSSTGWKPSGRIPSDRERRFREAENREAGYLGLPPR